jgi:hypothetical protein
MPAVPSRRTGAPVWPFAAKLWLCPAEFLSRREGLIVRGWSSVLPAGWVPDLVEVSEMGESAGIGRVVTTWVTALEKNFSSCCKVD